MSSSFMASAFILRQAFFFVLQTWPFGQVVMSVIGFAVPPPLPPPLPIPPPPPDPPPEPPPEPPPPPPPPEANTAPAVSMKAEARAVTATLRAVDDIRDMVVLH